MQQIVLAVLVAVFAVITFLPRIKNDFWTFRILEYPRLQKAFIGLVLLVLVVVLVSPQHPLFWWMVSAVAISLIYLAYKIFPYTALAPKEMKRAKRSDPRNELKVFTANVLQENKAYHRIKKQIRLLKPDVVFLVETDTDWERAMDELIPDYPHCLKEPLDNTYGLLLYSRLPIKDGAVRYLADREVPSVKFTAVLPSGAEVLLYGLHPKPPVPQESLTTTAKDKELMKVAFEIENYTGPCMVMGDLNDVAWSYVTELFRKVSGLLDPRRGRGFYSTFSANHWWMRFPLDYIFCSGHFGLVRMRKLDHNGSDHFAMFIHLQYNPAFARQQEAPEADADEREEAKEKAIKEPC